MWSWILEGVGLLGATLIGKKYWYGWIVLLCNAVFWFIYGLVSREYGFCVASIPYSYIYLRNSIRWKRQSRMPSEAPKTLSNGL